MNKPKANNFQLIRQLNFVKQAALAGALLERMLPNYELFSSATEFGDYSQIRKTLDLYWEKITFPKTKINVELLIEKLEPNIPELEQFDMFGTYPAIDVCTALITVLNALDADAEGEFVNIAKISQASVAKFIEYELTVAGEIADNQAIREHPLMKYEIEVLSELIEAVDKMGRLNGESAKALRLLVKQEGISNLGLEI